MQLDFQLDPGPASQPVGATLQVDSEMLPLRFVRNSRARRYVLRLAQNGVLRVTVPRGGSKREAIEVAQRHGDWIRRQLLKRRAEAGHDPVWRHGSEILFRGERTTIEVHERASVREIRFGEVLLVADIAGEDLRPVIELHLQQLARAELPARVAELAGSFEVKVSRVTVRNQRSRWGSCSRSGTLSLNWRLVQMPPSVSDYILIHELAHLRFMDHSPRYWKQVAAWCPDYRIAEAWLKRHGRELQWLPAKGGQL
ncbi:MAG TPA: hypothetical protein DCY13_24090 [Verrucomicrobiales bacterium]|nr:hypothetical protein [Verrucomicrobiales bacterium]